MSKFTDIQLLFFDIGSTLVDESKAYEHRIRDTIKNRDISYEQFCNAMIDFAKQGLNAYNEAVRFFGLNRTPWHSEDEVLYPETVSALYALSKRYKIGIIANQLPGTQERLNKMGIGGIYLSDGLIRRSRCCQTRSDNIPTGSRTGELCGWKCSHDRR